MTIVRAPGTAFDFGLDPLDEQRADQALRGMVVDLTFSGPCGLHDFTAEQSAQVASIFEQPDAVAAWIESDELALHWAINGTMPAYEQAWRASGISVANVQIGVGSAESIEGGRREIELRTRLPWLVHARSVDEMRAAHRRGDKTFFVNCQPHEPISRDLGLLHGAIDVGLAVLMLTYNEQDFVGAGCTELVDGGLTRFGRRVLDVLHERRVVVDVSHCGPTTTMDACRHTERPVMATHTGARSVFDHPRNKTDAELVAIAASGGVIGVYAVPSFLGPGEPSIEVMLDHIDHIARLVGVEHLAIGTDWPYQLPQVAIDQLWRVNEDMGFVEGTETRDDLRLAGFDSYWEFPNIARGLVARGYDDAAVAGVLGENALRVFDDVWRTT
jgi:membrane dipeptidase